MAKPNRKMSLVQFCFNHCAVFFQVLLDATMDEMRWASTLRTVGTVRSVLEMYCRRCQSNWLDGYNGAVVRRRARIWLIHSSGATRLPRRECPNCGATSSYCATRL